MIKNIEAVTAYLEQAIREFTDIAVVGISGGVDSSVVASICVRALGPENVHLVSMPYDDDDLTTFNKRSHELAIQLKAPHSVVVVKGAADALQSELRSMFPEGELNILTKANIRPRVRMSILYGVSGELGFRTKKRARVIGTGHLSEDLIGYDTKGGDALCDLFVLSDIVKSEVYQLAAHYNVPKSIIEAPPSAGLYRGQTDFEELGFSYDELEPATLAIFAYLKSEKPESALSPDLPEFANLDRRCLDFVIARYQAHSHKHKAPATVPCRKNKWF